MYRLTEYDKRPLTLFGKTYWWSVDEAGNLTLVSHKALIGAQRTLTEIAEAIR